MIKFTFCKRLIFMYVSVCVCVCVITSGAFEAREGIGLSGVRVTRLGAGGVTRVLCNSKKHS